MDPQFYPKRFDLLSGGHALTTLVYDAFFGLHLYRVGRDYGNRATAIKRLSEIIAPASNSDPITETALLRFYFSEEEIEACDNKKLVEGLKSRNSSFAERLSNYESAEGKGLKKLVEECIKLHSIVLSHCSHSRHRLAA